MKPAVANALRAIGALLLLVLAWTGVRGAIDQHSTAQTTGQQVQTAAQLVLGLFSFLALVTAFRARRWQRITFLGVLLGATLAGGFAPVVWGGQSVLTGIWSGIASLLVALIVIWLFTAGTRETPVVGEASSS